MICGSPGPFSEDKNLDFAKEVFSNFDLVTNREPISIELLKQQGFDVNKTKSLACPAFLFEPIFNKKTKEIISENHFEEGDIVGFILCGWNFTEGPFDKWPRKDSDYIQFAEVIEQLEDKYNVRTCLMSHSNGFHIPPAEFELIHGRDYPIVKQLQNVLMKRGIAKKVFALDGVYDTWTTKAIISNFSMLISGRIHAAVAGLSQSVPTVIIDYGHEPKAHKLKGFAKVAGMQDYVADPSIGSDIYRKSCECWEHREDIKRHLNQNIPLVKVAAKRNFSLIKELF